MCARVRTWCSTSCAQPVLVCCSSAWRERFNSAAKKERGRAPRPGVACWVIDRRRELVTRLKSPAVLRKVTPYMFGALHIIIFLKIFRIRRLFGSPTRRTAFPLVRQYSTVVPRTETCVECAESAEVPAEALCC
jgi:hypothetical protein